MDVYKIPIEYAFIVFPFIAFILTIPFLIHQYRKFGSIPILKSTIFYSMVLYIICAYFLVMLPLPSIEKVASMTGPTYQLVPFQFIKDIIATTSFDISNIKEFINIFKNTTVYTVLFNIVLTLPFGVYLRYIFKKKWYHSIIYTFLLSLFFEITQLSGLYGIYPRPYRLFDVDDLFINTLGGLLGHAITPLITFFIPTIEQLDEKGYKKGERVTLIRRAVSLMIDILFVIIFSIITKILFYNTFIEEYYLVICLIIYYILIPIFTSGKTIGKIIIKLKVSGLEDPVKWYQILVRNILLVGFVLYPNSWIAILDSYLDTAFITRIWHVIVFCQIANVTYYIYTVIVNQPHLFLYESLTGTKNISTITVEKSTKVLEKDVPEEKIVEKSKNKNV